MGGKKRVGAKGPQTDSIVIGNRTRTLSDGRTIQGVIYAPRIQGNGYVCESHVIEDGVTNASLAEDEDSLFAIELALSGLSGEMEAYCVVENSLQSTGFERWHYDLDLNALFQYLFELEWEEWSLRADTISHGRHYVKKRYDVEAIAAGATSVLDIDCSADLWPKIIRLRQCIRIRIVAIAAQNNSNHLLFANGRVPIVSRLSHPSAIDAPIASTKRLVVETDTEVEISIWAPRIETGALPWRCEYRIVGLEATIFAETQSVDSMGALRDVFDAIGDDLDRSSFTVCYTDMAPYNNGSHHGFTRYMESKDDAYLYHLFAVEMQRNRILYKLLTGEEVTEKGQSEEMLHFHLREIEKARLKYDRRRCDDSLDPDPLL